MVYIYILNIIENIFFVEYDMILLFGDYFEKVIFKKT